MSSPEETTASGRPKRRAAQPPPVGLDIEGRDAATGSCHCCGGMLSRTPESARQCGKCSARYHAYDCGNRRRDAGFTDFDQCPRCAEMCMCTGGPMLCHTRSLRDSRREKRQHTVGSSTALNAADGSGAPTETNEGASAEDSAPDDRRVPDIDDSMLEPVDSMVFDDPTVEDDSAAGRGGNRSRREWLPAELRIENEALRAENEALRQRLAAGGGSPPSVPVSMPEPRRVDDMMSDGERKVTSPMQGAVEVFFPESEAPDRDREPTPVNCFNASQSMYIGDAWSAEIVQAYRERVAAQGGFDAGPLTETADKQKIFWRNVWFFTRMVVLFSFLLWSIAWHIESAALHGGEWHYPLFALLYVFATVWAYGGYRNLLAYGRMALADRERKRKKAVALAAARV